MMTDELMDAIRERVKMDDALYSQVDQSFNDLRPQAEQDRAALLEECDRLRRLLDRAIR